jgi:hypothetical protein
VDTSTNLADLITSKIREAAEAAGVDYDALGSTALRQVTWGRVKEEGR